MDKLTKINIFLDNFFTTPNWMQNCVIRQKYVYILQRWAAEKSREKNLKGTSITIACFNIPHFPLKLLYIFFVLNVSFCNTAFKRNCTRHRLRLRRTSNAIRSWLIMTNYCVGWKTPLGCSLWERDNVAKLNETNTLYSNRTHCSFDK